MTTMRMHTTKEVAVALGVPETRLQDLLRRGKIAEPLRIGGRRVWTDAQRENARAVVKENA